MSKTKLQEYKQTIGLTSRMINRAYYLEVGMILHTMLVTMLLHEMECLYHLNNVYERDENI